MYFDSASRLIRDKYYKIHGYSSMIPIDIWIQDQLKICWEYYFEKLNITPMPYHQYDAIMIYGIMEEIGYVIECSGMSFDEAYEFVFQYYMHIDDLAYEDLPI